MRHAHGWHEFGDPLWTIPRQRDRVIDEVGEYDAEAFAQCRKCNLAMMVYVQEEAGGLTPMTTGSSPLCDRTDPKYGDKFPARLRWWRRIVPRSAA